MLEILSISFFLSFFQEGTMIIMFLLSILMLYSSSTNWSFLMMNLGADTLSSSMLMLTIWMILLVSMILEKKMMIILMVLNISLLMCFSSVNLMFFYIWFEATLLPMTLLILKGGQQPERVIAIIYLFLYTIIASLPLLLTLNFMSNEMNSLCSMIKTLKSMNWIASISLILAFLVKFPLFLVHQWLVKAHVEAPVSGSMLLASILLKLGGYGLIRLYFLVSELKCLLMSWALTGGVLAGIYCSTRSDIKILIALSSVAHMSMVSASIFSLGGFGLSGALIVMIAHGFISSGLFYIANSSYKRSSTRNFKLLSSFLMISPVYALLSMLFVMGNMAAPPSLNLLGEINMILSLSVWSKWSCILSGFMLFLAAVYSLMLYTKSIHGNGLKEIKTFSCLELKEILICFLHLFPVVILTSKWSNFELGL